MNQPPHGRPEHPDLEGTHDTDRSSSHGTGGPGESFFGVPTGYSYPGIRRDTHRMARVFAAAFALVVVVCIVGTLVSVYL